MIFSRKGRKARFWKLFFVDEDGIEFFSAVYARIHHDDGMDLADFAEDALVRVVNGTASADYEPVDLLLEHHLKLRALLVHVVVRYAEDYAVVVSPARLLDSLYDVREERVRDVRDENGDYARRHLVHPARERVRREVVLFYRLLNFLARPRADRRASVNHARNRRDGNAAVARQIVNGIVFGHIPA